jgi:hypothetical protein
MAYFKTDDIVIDYHMSAEQVASLPALEAWCINGGDKPSFGPYFMTVVFRPRLSDEKIRYVTQLLEAHGCRSLKTEAGNKWTYLPLVDLNTTLVHRLEAEGFNVFQMDSYAEIDEALSEKYLEMAA